MAVKIWINDTMKYSCVRLSLFVLALSFCTSSFADSWNKARTSTDATANRWQYVVCENGAGWRSCNLPVNISLSATPSVITGLYPGSLESTSTISAVVTDYFGNPVADDVTLDWSSTAGGAFNPTAIKTNANGKASVVFTAPAAVGPIEIIATAREDGGNSISPITLKDKWVAANSPTYTPWVNSGALHSCTWTPATSTVKSGVAFTQTSTDCKQTQNRYRQEREVSVVTGNYRNFGFQIIETRVLNGYSSSRSAIGTKSTLTNSSFTAGYYETGKDCSYYRNILISIPPQTGSTTARLSHVTGVNMLYLLQVSQTQFFVSHFRATRVHGSYTSSKRGGYGIHFRLTVTNIDNGISTTAVYNGSVYNNIYSSACVSG